MGARPNRIYDSFRDFMVNRGTCETKNSDSHCSEDDIGRSLMKYLLGREIYKGEKVHLNWKSSSFPLPPKNVALLWFSFTLSSQKSLN
jgi:hypothetical protein